MNSVSFKFYLLLVVLIHSQSQKGLVSSLSPQGPMGAGYATYPGHRPVVPI